MEAVLILRNQIKDGLMSVKLGSFTVHYSTDDNPPYTSKDLLREVHKFFPQVGIEEIQEIRRTYKGKHHYSVEWKIYV